MLSRRRLLGGAVGAAGAFVLPAPAQEGVSSAPRPPPAICFRMRRAVSGRVVPATPALQGRVRALGGPPTIWETEYAVFTVTRAGWPRGDRGGESASTGPSRSPSPSTPEARVHDLAVLSYPRGVRRRGARAPLPQAVRRQDTVRPVAAVPRHPDIRAPRPSSATGRAARKALAVLKSLGELE